MKKAIVIYCSFTGNTEKVARSVAAGLEHGGCAVELMTLKEAEAVSFDDYDLVCFGVPSINWQPPKPAQEYLNKKFAQYKEKYGPVSPCAPHVQGRTRCFSVHGRGRTQGCARQNRACSS